MHESQHMQSQHKLGSWGHLTSKTCVFIAQSKQVCMSSHSSIRTYKDKWFLKPLRCECLIRESVGIIDLMRPWSDE